MEIPPRTKLRVLDFARPRSGCGQPRRSGHVSGPHWCFTSLPAPDRGHVLAARSNPLVIYPGQRFVMTIRISSLQPSRARGQNIRGRDRERASAGLRARRRLRLRCSTATGKTGTSPLHSLGPSQDRERDRQNHPARACLLDGERPRRRPPPHRDTPGPSGRTSSKHGNTKPRPCSTGGKYRHGGSISGWVVHWVSRSERYGKPRCWLILRDGAWWLVPGAH